MSNKNNHFQAVLNVKRFSVIAFFLAVSACSFGTPSYSKVFLFEPGKKSLEINVDQYCTYEIGVSFASEMGGQAIKSIFGHARQVRLPATVDLALFNASGKLSFSVSNVGGPMLAYRYGPNPLQLIFGKAYLEPGVYVAIIDIKLAGESLSELESKLFLAVDPKTTCKKAA